MPDPEKENLSEHNQDKKIDDESVVKPADVLAEKEQKNIHEKAREVADNIIAKANEFINESRNALSDESIKKNTGEGEVPLELQPVVEDGRVKIEQEISQVQSEAANATQQVNEVLEQSEAAPQSTTESVQPGTAESRTGRREQREARALEYNKANYERAQKLYFQLSKGEPVSAKDQGWLKRSFGDPERVNWVTKLEEYLDNAPAEVKHKPAPEARIQTPEVYNKAYELYKKSKEGDLTDAEKRWVGRVAGEPGEAGYERRLEEFLDTFPESSKTGVRQQEAQPSPTESKESEEQIFSTAKSFDELYELIDRVGEIKGTAQSYTPDVLKSTIDKVRAGKLVAETITRYGGLRQKVLDLLNSSPVQPETPASVSETAPVETEKLEQKEIIKILQELEGKLPELKLKWQKHEKKDEQGKKTGEYFKASLEENSKKDLENLLAEYKLPPEVKDRLQNSLTQRLEDNFTRSITEKSQLEYSHMLKHQKKKLATVGGAIVAVGGASLATRIYLGGLGALATSLGRVGTAIGIGMGAGALRQKWMESLGPKFEKWATMSKGEQSELDKVGKDTAASSLTKENIKTVAGQTMKELLLKELSLGPQPADTRKAVKELLQQQSPEAFSSPEQLEQFSRQLAAIHELGKRNDKKLAGFMEYKPSGKAMTTWESAKRGGGYAGATVGATELVRSLGLGKLADTLAPSLTAGVMGAYTYGKPIEQVLKRAGIEERYKIMEEQISGKEVKRGFIKETLRKINKGKEKQVTSNITQERVNEVASYLTSGLLSFDPVMEARAQAFLEQAAAQDMLPNQGQVTGRVKELEDKLSKEGKLESRIAKGAGFTLGVASGYLTTLATEKLGIFSGHKTAPTEELKQQVPGKTTGPSVEVPPPGKTTGPIEVEIKGKIDTFTEALDKAVHQAPQGTQDNFIHKVLGTPMQVTNGNRGELLQQAINKLSVDNLHGVGKMGVENEVFVGNKLKLEADGSWDVIKGSGTRGPEAVPEAVLREQSADIHAKELGLDPKEVSYAGKGLMKTTINGTEVIVSNKGQWHATVDGHEINGSLDHLSKGTSAAETIRHSIANAKNPLLDNTWEQTGSNFKSTNIDLDHDLPPGAAHFNHNELHMVADDVEDPATHTYDSRPEIINLEDKNGNVVDHYWVDKSDTRSLSEIIQDAHNNFVKADRTVGDIENNLSGQAQNLSLPAKAELGRMIGVNLHEGEPLTTPQIDELHKLGEVVGGRSDLVKSIDFNSFIRNNYHELTHQQLVDDAKAVDYLHNQGFNNVDVKSVDNIIKTSAWLDIGGPKHEGVSGFTAQIEHGVLHTNLQSPLSGKGLEVPLKTNAEFNTEFVKDAMAKLTIHSNLENQAYSNIESMVGKGDASKILNLNCGPDVEQQMNEITTSRLLGLIKLSSGHGEDLFNQIKGKWQIDLQTPGGKVGDRVSEFLANRNSLEPPAPGGHKSNFELPTVKSSSHDMPYTLEQRSEDIAKLENVGDQNANIEFVHTAFENSIRTRFVNVIDDRLSHPEDLQTYAKVYNTPNAHVDENSLRQLFNNVKGKVAAGGDVDGYLKEFTKSHPAEARILRGVLGTETPGTLQEKAELDALINSLVGSK